MWRLGLMLICFAAASAAAQTSYPDLKGTWSGNPPAVMYGKNEHHPVGPGNDTPRVDQAEFFFVITGQDGANVWGYSYSNKAKTNEPFAWSIASDRRTLIGADTDGYFHITLQSGDQMDLCYAQNRLGPSGMILSVCGPFKREKK
ncbi:MAG: hypothetical protein JO339_04290 [Alphaproteobacteria bacterium]|nr:hypothetical protein [Alphaproteobacteria bacterium]